MLASILMGLIAGARSMTPLAAVSIAANTDRLPRHTGAPGFLSHPAMAASASALAIGEMIGDKLHSAPDRIVLAGMAARVATGALAGAALAPRRKRLLGAALGAGAAVLAAYMTFNARMRALERYGQMRSGLAEDALVLAGAAALTAGAARLERPHIH